jgi:hypothetical protein
MSHACKPARVSAHGGETQKSYRRQLYPVQVAHRYDDTEENPYYAADEATPAIVQDTRMAMMQVPNLAPQPDTQVTLFPSISLTSLSGSQRRLSCDGCSILHC